ncbi:MAG: sodium:proton antiporter, partial [Flavobacteriales bacterium]
LQIDKAATALLTGVLCWTAYMLGGEQILQNSDAFQEYLNNNPDGTYWDFIGHHQILEHLGEISEILFFLLLNW